MSGNELNMSDEDFLNETPPVEETVETPEEEKDIPVVETEEVKEPSSEVPAPESEEVVETEETKEQEEPEQPTKDKSEVEKPEETVLEDKTKEVKADKSVEKAEEVKPAEAAPIDYKAAYEQITKPFKANGKEIRVNTPEEAIQLMQMGANYTKKMQALQPHLKMVKMLEQNNLLTEEKLNFLIDLEKKNPAAISKLLSDGGIDPLTIDTDDSKSYVSGNYAPSDNEVALTEIVDSYKNDPQATEVLRDAYKNFDDTSKTLIYQDPNTLNVLVEHKKAGIYDKIVEEYDRRRVFGQFTGTPFLEAYLVIGHEMIGTNQQGNQPQGIVDTRPAKVQTTQVVNSDKAKSAGIAKKASQAKSNFNPLAMSDEEFLKSDFAKNL